MIRATIKLRASSPRVAKSIIESVTPDNQNMKGLTVASRTVGSDAKFMIRYDGRIETFISTMEDLLRCIQAASMTLNKMKGREKS